MSLENRIQLLAEHIASKIKNIESNLWWWIEVSIWETNTLTNKWIWIQTDWEDFSIWFEDWL